MKKLLVVIILASVASAFTGKGKKQPCAYQITIVNKYWRQMHLQVRTGAYSSPEQNPIFYDGYLQQGESVTVPYDVNCYYRRDANPDSPDNVNFTNWTGAGCSWNTPCVEENP